MNAYGKCMFAWHGGSTDVSVCHSPGKQRGMKCTLSLFNPNSFGEYAELALEMQCTPKSALVVPTFLLSVTELKPMNLPLQICIINENEFETQVSAQRAGMHSVLPKMQLFFLFC